MNRLAVGLAVGAGYVLGRTKKAKFAFAVGTMVAGKRLHLNPKALGALVTQQLQNNPQFKEIGDQLREDLRGVGKAATGSLVNRQLDGLADRLHDRTQGVQDRLSGVVPEDVKGGAKGTAKGATKGRIGGRDEHEEHDERDERDERDEEADGDESGTAERDEDERSGRSQRRGKAPAKKTAAKTAAKSVPRSAPKAAAKKAPAKRTQGTKSAQGNGRKKTAAAGGAARRTASSARTGGGRTKGDRDHG
ncbi:DNA primase [Streptomyces sp. NPDC087300]|uniref:DNA primase n=1 Tax=Streptomyces sp. NPDC087300 TaxID=3365780 RepID=UPI00380423D5